IASELCPDHPEPKIELARATLYLRRFDDAEEVINQLKSMSPKRELVAKKIIDIQLQLLTRKADHYHSTHEPSNALKALEKVREFFDTIKSPDELMRQRIEKLGITAAQLRNHFQDDPERSKEATELVSWIESTTKAQRRHRQTAGSSSLSLNSVGEIKQ